MSLRPQPIYITLAATFVAVASSSALPLPLQLQPAKHTSPGQYSLDCRNRGKSSHDLPHTSSHRPSPPHAARRSRVRSQAHTYSPSLQPPILPNRPPSR
ncbi:hypothetical protein BD310DRAFT_934424 [Dichomitus squalens]|uniref:Ig-like domain-containing protein n=1 Tax=Dichomitus squalens TaxID=114155 RepID=A0A4Q9PLR3_9APHY|nr:hypothetical protein BD310DRAFT_934424 [Dichomitus squalens]